MNIKNPEDFKSAIEKLVSGEKEIAYDIARYTVYNYYLNIHIKADSPQDKENELIYSDFKDKHPELYKKVFEWEKYLFKKFEEDI